MAYISIEPGNLRRPGQRVAFTNDVFTSYAGLPKARSIGVAMPKPVPGISGQTNVTVLSSPVGTAIYKASQKILQVDIVTNTKGTSIVRSAMVPNKPIRAKYPVTIVRGK